MGVIGYRCDFVVVVVVVVVWILCSASLKEMEGDGEIILTAFGYVDDTGMLPDLRVGL